MSSVENIVTEYLKKIQRPLFDNIPLRLRAGRHHVVWNAEKRGQGIGKTPYRARTYLGTGEYYKASSTNGKSWSTFDDARKAYERGHFAGIGYVLNGTITLVDIDHCIRTIVTEDGIEEEIHPAALEIMELLNATAERSPSREGIHIFPAGAIPPDAKNRYNYKGLEIEIYSEGRYSTLTGDLIEGMPTQVEDRQDQLTALIDHLTRWEEENTSGGVCVLPNGDGDEQDQVQPLLLHEDESIEAPAPRVVEQPERSGRAAAGKLEVLPNNQSQQDQGQRSTHQSTRPATLEDLPLEDQAVYAQACAARNGQTFMALWSGGDPNHRGDISKADFEFVLQLLYWTGDDPDQTERLFRVSGRYRAEKTDRRTTRSGKSYLQMTIYNALRKRQKIKAPRRSASASNFTTNASSLPDDEPDPPTTPGPGHQRKPARQDQRITHVYPWMNQHETPEERQQKLEDVAQSVAQQIEQHITSGSGSLLIANVAPGIGKSTTVAPLGLSVRDGGAGYNLAWIAERRNMTAQVPALQGYRQIQPCTRENCPSGFHLHWILGEKGYNTQVVHKRHLCLYNNQHKQTGSAVYQLAHCVTRYPANHQGIIIDELDLTKWLPEREITVSRLSAAAKLYDTNSTADLLIRAIQAVITDASQGKKPLHGQDLFNAIDERSGGQLYGWITELRQDNQYVDTRPRWHKLEEEDEAAQELEAINLAPIIFPHIMQALDTETLKWKWRDGQAWNSRLRVGPGPHGWALYITEPRTITPGAEGLPSRAILDATADQELLSLLFKEQIELRQAPIDPPAGTRHIAVRTEWKGTKKRYGKTALCSTPRKKKKDKPDDDKKPNKYLQRVIAEARYILRDLDRNDEARTAQKIGLISFMRCVDQIGEALDIPSERRLHFWAARGSNALADCTILLVVGTPSVHPDTIARLARALWADDPEPIDPTPRKDAAGHVIGYVDPRMQRVSQHLTYAELTQCAHRNRALRTDRTVVTFCSDEIGYLPATQTITDLPQLTADGQDLWKLKQKETRQRLDQARRQLEQQGKTLAMITVRELRAAAGVSTDATTEYLHDLRQQAREVAQHDQQAAEIGALPSTTGQSQQEHTHTPNLCSLPNDFVPELVNDTLLTNIGTNLAPAPDATPGACQIEAQPVAERPAPPRLGKPCCHCGHVDDWMYDLNVQRWICSCYSWWYEQPERRKIL